MADATSEFREQLRPVCAALRDAAELLFERQGFHAVGVQAISNATKDTRTKRQHTKRSLYQCFGDKDGLIRSVLHEAEWRWELAAERAGDEPGDWVDAMLVELADDNPLVLIARGLLELTDEGPARDKAWEAYQAVRDTLERHAVGGRPDLAADRAAAVLLGATVVSWDDRDGGAAMNQVADIIRALLHQRR